MNSFQLKLNTACLILIAISSAIIAFRQLQPAFINTENDQVMDTRSANYFYKAGGRLIPVQESTEDKLRREYPDGKIYK